MHKQTIIKVNTQVDEGIARLVEILNGISGVITLDSCQRGAAGDAYVFFTFGTDWKDLAELLQSISSALADIQLPCGFILTMEWWGSNKKPRAHLSCRPEHVAVLADGIERIIPILSRRMYLSVDDKEYTESHS